MPLAASIAKSAVEAGAAPLQFLGPDGAGLPRRQRQAHVSVRRRLAPVVQPGDHHLSVGVARVDQPQAAALIVVAAGVEDGHMVAVLSAAGDVVNAGQKAVAGADVGECPQ